MRKIVLPGFFTAAILSVAVTALTLKGHAFGRLVIECFAVASGAFLVMEGCCKLATRHKVSWRRITRIIIGTALLTFHLPTLLALL